ncbi:MAG: hypothetical protein ACRD2X_22860 [Vicinamibacteraceae bacterium]
MIHLSGRGALVAEARRAIALARSVRGVGDVRSDLHVGLPPSRARVHP